MELQPSVLCLKHHMLHFPVNLKILIPEFGPEFRFKDLSQGKHQPTKEPSVTPALANFFDAIRDSTKRGFDRIGIQGQSLVGLQLVIQKGRRVLVKAREISFGHRILFRIHRGQQFKSLSSLLSQLVDALGVRWVNLFQSLLWSGKRPGSG